MSAGLQAPTSLTAALTDLAELKSLLTRHRLVPESLLQRLRQHLGVHPAATMLERLIERIQSFDFKAALEAVWPGLDVRYTHGH